MTQTTTHTPAVRVSNGNQIIDGESYTLLATCNGDGVARALADKLNAHDDLLAALAALESSYVCCLAEKTKGKIWRGVAEINLSYICAAIAKAQGKVV